MKRNRQDATFGLNNGDYQLRSGVICDFSAGRRFLENMMETESLTWVGLEVEDAYIERILGEGGFSVVYLAKMKGGGQLAFKVSRPKPQRIEQITGMYNTMAQAAASAGIADIEPTPSEVIRLQYEKLMSLESPQLVKPFSSNTIGEMFYYTMPVIDGQTLRSKLKQRTARVADLRAVADACAKLAKLDVYHGDLKPENVLITADGPMLIDPGYFGTLTVNGVKMRQCYITTPAYYPLHEPDDLLAMGIMMWEFFTGRHPFAVRGYSGRSDLSRCGEHLIEKVRDQELVGRYNYSSILDLKFPTEINNNLPQKAEVMLLKALGLKRTSDNKLEVGEGFESFDEFVSAFSGG